MIFRGKLFALLAVLVTLSQSQAVIPELSDYMSICAGSDNRTEPSCCEKLSAQTYDYCTLCMPEPYQLCTPRQIKVRTDQNLDSLFLPH